MASCPRAKRSSQLVLGNQPAGRRARSKSRLLCGCDRECVLLVNAESPSDCPSSYCVPGPGPMNRDQASSSFFLSFLTQKQERTGRPAGLIACVIRIARQHANPPAFESAKPPTPPRVVTVSNLLVFFSFDPGGDPVLSLLPTGWPGPVQPRHHTAAVQKISLKRHKGRHSIGRWDRCPVN